MGLLSCLLVLPQSASAQYHWKDDKGRDHYGGNPPKDARNVRSLSGRTFSRYSSDKLLHAFKGNAISESDIKAGISTSRATKTPKAVSLPVDTNFEENLMPELEQAQLSVKHDKQKRVTECSVVVKNLATIPAPNVIVSFEFNDGTLVPAAGPESIDAGSSGKYSVPPEMLPISIKGYAGNDSGPKPKVSIKGGGE